MNKEESSKVLPSSVTSRIKTRLVGATYMPKWYASKRKMKNKQICEQEKNRKIRVQPVNKHKKNEMQVLADTGHHLKPLVTVTGPLVCLASSRGQALFLSCFPPQST